MVSSTIDMATITHTAGHGFQAADTSQLCTYLPVTIATYCIQSDTVSEQVNLIASFAQPF